jgi:ChrR Cupin-like domain
MMTRPDTEDYPDAVQGVMAQLPQVDQDTPLPLRLRPRVQAMIDGFVPAVPFGSVPPPAAMVFVTRLAAFLDLEEARVQQLLAALSAAPGPPWTPSGLPGGYLLPLAGGPRVAGATCCLLYGRAGHGMPRHRHLGDEWTFVLSGWVEEDSGHRWGPGDLLHRVTGSMHAFSVLEPTPCVCAVVSYGSIAFVTARPEAGG